jgi:hypothetical protein
VGSAAIAVAGESLIKSTSAIASAATAVIATAIKAPPFQIASVHTSTRWLKLFVYGNYGVGKTQLAGSSALVPQMRDVLMIDAEAGDMTIAMQDEKSYVEAAEHIDVIRVSTFKELARVQEFLKLHCKLRDENNTGKLKELEQRLRKSYDEDQEPRKYNTVIIDSLTEIETFSMYQLLGITDATKLDEETQSPEWAEYKKNNNQILRSVRAFRDLPMNVIMTSAAVYTQDEFKRFVYQPSLTGKLSKQVQGFMDIVGFLVVVPGEDGSNIRRMYVQPSAKFDAKNRLSRFKGEFFDRPSVLSILQAVGLYDTSGSSLSSVRAAS